MARPRFKVTVDATALQRAERIAASLAPKAAMGGAEVLGALFVELHTAVCPKDTNRYANGYIDAGNKAGVTRTPLLPINASSRHSKYVEQLTEQLNFAQANVNHWERWKQRYEAEGGKRLLQPFYRKILAKLRSWTKTRDRAAEELAKAQGDPSILFFGGQLTRGDLGFAGSRGRRLGTVRTKVYGGEGRVTVGGKGGAVVELTNKEPHARIVNAHSALGHPVATTIAALRVFRLQPVGKKYVESLRPSGLVRKVA